MNFKPDILAPLTHLFYPHVCDGCGSDVIDDDNLLCLHCIHELPHTNFAFLPDNPVEKIFWGRSGITAAMSEFYFSKGSLIQTLIHQLKYKGNKAIGLFLGAMMGNSLLNSSRFEADVLIPLPLFPDKEFKRGYNQATVLCNGISRVMNIPVVKNNVVRKRHTETQTRKHRDERWQNVEGSFEIVNPVSLEGKHILLVDDVVTTGATLEACAEEILNIAEIKLSIATLAIATK